MYWRIWFELYKNGKRIGAGVWFQHYKYKGNAERWAKHRFGEPHINKRTGDVYEYTWIISQTNPRINKKEVNE
jgi:hypothetical protein